MSSFVVAATLAEAKASIEHAELRWKHDQQSLLSGQALQAQFEQNTETMREDLECVFFVCFINLRVCSLLVRVLLLLVLLLCRQAQDDLQIAQTKMRALQANVDASEETSKRLTDEIASLKQVRFFESESCRDHNQLRLGVFMPNRG